MVHVTGNADRHIPLAAIKELPAHEITTEFKCVEGWSRVVNWKGVRLADFLNKFGAPASTSGFLRRRMARRRTVSLTVTMLAWTGPARCIRKRCCATR